MVVLGIDPGSRKTGYGVLEAQGRNLRYMDSGVLSFNTEGTIMDRLGVMYDSCIELVERFAPEEIAVESLIKVKSVPSAMTLAQARGALIAAFSSTHRGKIFEYSPRAIKGAVTGSGGADKMAVERVLQMMFKGDLRGGQFAPAFHDESDALAIAVCHALSRPSNYKRRKAPLAAPEMDV